MIGLGIAPKAVRRLSAPDRGWLRKIEDFDWNFSAAVLSIKLN